MFVHENFGQDGLADCTETVQSGERRQPTFGPLAAGSQLLQRRNGALVRSLDQELLCHVALPAAGTVEGGDQSGGVEPVEPRNRPRFFIYGEDTIEAPFVVTSPQIETFLPGVGDPLRMF